MTGKKVEITEMQGLQDQQVLLLQKKYGKNIFRNEKQHRILFIVAGIFREPMFILLTIACTLYFILGNTAEGIMMAIAMIIVTAISLYQEVKSSRALESLKQFTEPKVTVIRDSRPQTISNEELVPGDIILLEEGMKVPADSYVLRSNDLSVDESIITGEAFPVEKNEVSGQNELYQGTTINSGKCIARVSATGNNTVLGKIGKSVAAYNPAKTLLQRQINSFVRRLAAFGLLGFFIIFLVNFLHYHEITTSLLFALTLAMSAVPEEIPVAFSSFMALGSYKMSKLGIISRQPQVIENLGAVTVLCLDKTGTITENKMQVTAIYDFEKDVLTEISNNTNIKNNDVLFYAALASESDPFDAMEKAIWELYFLSVGDNHQKPEMIHEYPLEGKPPMMTHVYQHGNEVIVAAKGGPERILAVSGINKSAYEKVIVHVKSLAAKGYRVLGVASALHKNGDWPEKQDDFAWKFLGLVALYDPPKQNSKAVLKKIRNAKIDIKLLTGDFPETALNIAEQTGIGSNLPCITGNEVIEMDEEELKLKVKNVSVFARMFPEAKVKVIQSLKANKEIVAMTGDGVNDGPALKIADIGIAMGKKGTETARQASDLILTDDNLERIVVAISEGRRIFNNLIKAVRYIISIHIPIILTASVPVVAGWKYPNIFTPIHVIFLELIMGPTCSIFFEREPVEKSIMLKPPRSNTHGLFTRNELSMAIVQGLIITVGTLGLYYFFMTTGHNVEETRTVVFTSLIISNVFLTFASRSYTKTIFQSIHYKNRLALVIVIASLVFLALLYFSTGIQSLFQLTSISSVTFGLCLLISLTAVGWFEIYKWIKDK